MRIYNLAVIVATVSAVAPGMSVSLEVSKPSPSPLGDAVTWQAGVSGEGSFRYRFRVRETSNTLSFARRRGEPASGYRTIRDFGVNPSLTWTAAEHEGFYEIEVSVKNRLTGEIVTAARLHQFLPRASPGLGVVNPTGHPLVFLFSAPSCLTGARMFVQFQDASGVMQRTPSKTCRAGYSMNFYLAGLRASTSYTAQSVTEIGALETSGPAVTFQSGALPALAWTQNVVIPPPAGTPQPVLLGTAGGSQIATDLAGRIIWFNPEPFTWATRPEAGGYLWGVMEDAGEDITFQSIRAVDLTGMTVLETNAERVNEQLEAMGRRPISGFHHEVRPIPGNRIVALAAVEQTMTDVQGEGERNILGDMVVVFDRDLNVVWAWDSFDYLDARRPSTTGDVCAGTSSACPPFYLASDANDWTHANSVQFTPDGNLLISLRHQDWLVKVDYSNGTGSGAVLWRLGLNGDFTSLDSDPYPWFSHQHDGNFEAGNPSRLVVFDNSNLRVTALGGSVFSRGQVYELDESRRTAKLVMNVSLGVLSLAVGSAQRLDNGNYHFTAGFVFSQGRVAAHQFEVDPSGRIVAQFRATAGLYRSFRMRDMYSDAETR